jgi:glycerate kinase
MTGAAGGLAGGLWANLRAKLVAGAPFVLDAIGFDRRMLASAAVIVGEGQLDATSLQGKIVSEIATRARQNGVPAYAFVGRCALTLFDVRILDLQMIWEARDDGELAEAGASLARLIERARR